MLGFNQTAVPDDAHQTSGRVSAATKTKHKNLVASFVVFGEELVTLDNIDLKSGADRAADEADRTSECPLLRRTISPA